MIKQFYRQNTATSKVRNFNNENPPAGTVLPAASNSSSTMDMTLLLAAVVVDGLAVVVGAPVVDTALLLAAVVVDGLAVVVGAPVVDTALLLAAVVVDGATSQTLSEIALPLARMPFVHDVQFQQWLWFDAFANVPSSQELQRRSPTVVPACEINDPGAQIVIAVQAWELA